MKVIMITWSIGEEKYQNIYEYGVGKNKIRDAHDVDEANRMCRAMMNTGKAKSDTATCFRRDISKSLFDELTT